MLRTRHALEGSAPEAGNHPGGPPHIQTRTRKDFCVSPLEPGPRGSLAASRACCCYWAGLLSRLESVPRSGHLVFSKTDEPQKRAPAQHSDLLCPPLLSASGLQAQTAECLVIAEVAAPQMLIVLNKVDLLPQQERAKSIRKAAKRLAQTLQARLSFVCGTWCRTQKPT